MNFKQALNELISGKKIRRKNWEDGHYWVLDEDRILVNSIGVVPMINRNQLMEQNNWEVYVDDNKILIEELGGLKYRIENIVKRIKEAKEGTLYDKQEYDFEGTSWIKGKYVKQAVKEFVFAIKNCEDDKYLLMKLNEIFGEEDLKEEEK